MASEPGIALIVEDDPHIADLVELYLRREGFRVLQAQDGTKALETARRERPRVVILDLGLPGEIDGLEVCRQLRAKQAVPIIILTARDSEVDRVLGLELGADDYVVKPFSPRELVARIRAVLRRAEGAPKEQEVYVIGEIEVNMARREVKVAGKPVSLATREFDLLAYLAANEGLALTRRQLLDGVWGPGWYGDERTVDVHIRQLRKKLGNRLPLATVWGVGYRLG
jgi:DNA-binding response OmpR family regulator